MAEAVLGIGAAVTIVVGHDATVVTRDEVAPLTPVERRHGQVPAGALAATPLDEAAAVDGGGRCSKSVILERKPAAATANPKLVR